MGGKEVKKKKKWQLVLPFVSTSKRTRKILFWLSLLPWGFRALEGFPLCLRAATWTSKPQFHLLEYYSIISFFTRAAVKKTKLCQSHFLLFFFFDSKFLIVFMHRSHTRHCPRDIVRMTNCDNWLLSSMTSLAYILKICWSHWWGVQ